MVVVVIVVVPDAALTDGVGIRRAAPFAETAIAVFITLGRAVAAKAVGTTQKTANKLIVFLRNAIP
jgi:hypothetical protein